MVTPARSNKAPLVEVFTSIQGEGSHVGRPMAFVRVAVCPIRCTYCDTPNSYTARPGFHVAMGTKEVEEQNPVTGKRAAELALESAGRSVFGHAREVPQMVSVTGGEPLLYPGFVSELGSHLRDAGAEMLLETAALDVEALAACLHVVDHLSADYKLPETLEDGGALEDADPGEQNVRCAELALERGIPTDVKMVLTAGVRDRSLQQALQRLGRVRNDVRLILQPVTPFGAETRALPRDRLFEISRMVASAGFAARVIPQTHKLLDIR